MNFICGFSQINPNVIEPFNPIPPGEVVMTSEDDFWMVTEDSSVMISEEN